jgi:TolB protein
MAMRKTNTSTPTDRRRFMVMAGAGIGSLAFGGEQAFGQFSGQLDTGQNKPIPIAIPEFLSADPKLGADISNVVAADLANSGLFQVLPRDAYIERIQNMNVPPNYASWRTVGAEALIVGQANLLPDGRVQVEARVWDIVTAKPLAGNRFATPTQNWRRIGHQAADVAYEKLTGGARYFDTRIVFVDESGPKDKRAKRLAIMDQDGANVQYLSQGRELVLTPRFSPTTQEITFMQYVGDQGRVMLMNVETKQREVVGSFQGTTFAPRFSPDGQRLVMSMTNGGDTGLLELDLRSKQVRNLTSGGGINTGPSFSPDGKQIAFESDREGSQQLFVMGGTGIRRLSTGEGRYSTPVWSPRGDYIAFTKQMSGAFLIGVMKPDGSGERILTEGYHNEGPTWAPNGRVLMFFRESQGANGGPKLFSVDITGRNERQVPTPSFGSDPAWSPLLT